MKEIGAILLTLLLSFASAYMPQETVVDEFDIEGVWRTEGFAPFSIDEEHASLYVREILADGRGSMNLYITGLSIPPMREFRIFSYEIVDGQFVLSSHTGNWVEITILPNGNMQFDMQDVFHWRGERHYFYRSFVLYHALSELPFGWTGSDLSEALGVRVRIREETEAIARRLGEVLDMPVRRALGSYTQFFVGEYSVLIDFIGETPVPTGPQFHVAMPPDQFSRASQTNFDIGPPFPFMTDVEIPPPSVNSANDWFVLRHGQPVSPDWAEWIEMFRGLEDIFEW